MDSTKARVGAHLVVSVALVAITLPLASAGAQLACTTSWINASGGAWNNDGNWDNNQPDAGDNACITMNGTYTVVVSDFKTVNSVQVGGTTGTQTLAITDINCSNSATELTLNNGGTVGSKGEVALTRAGDPGCSSAATDNVILNVAGGTLTNNGTIKTITGSGGLGTHHLKGNITNNATVDIDMDTFFHEVGNDETFLNKGTLDIANGTRFELSANGGTSFTNGTGGSIVSAGSAHVFVGNQNTYNQGAGTTTGARPVVVNSGSINYTGTGASNIFFRFFGNLSGDIGANQDLTIEGVNCTNTGTQLTANASFTNNGDITLTRLGDPGCSNGVEDAILNIASGTMTNNGTLNTVAGAGGNGDHQLKGNITNNGTVDIDINTFFQEISNNETFLNQGTLDIADDTRFEVVANQGTTFTNGTDGSIVAAGSGHLFVGAQNTYKQGAGTTTGARPVVVNSGHINYTGTGASNIFFRFTGNLSGDIGADQDLTIEAVNCTNAGTELTANASFTNEGDITLTRFGDGNNCQEGVGLRIANGTMTNQGTLTSDSGTGGTGPSKIQGSLTNGPGGVIHVNRSLILEGSGATHRNAGGLVDIGVNQTLSANSGLYVQTSGETALAGGTGGISAAASVSIQGGTLTGTGTISPSLSNTGGVVASGGSPGILNVNGPYTQGAAGTLEVEIEGDTPGTEHDKLAITGAASLDGTLDICTGSSFPPAVDDRFQILTHASATGTFATVNGASAPGGNHYVPDYGAAETALDVVAGSSGPVAICEGTPLQITSVTPDEGGDACCATIFVHGVRLEPGAELTLSRAGEADIAASGVEVAADGRSLSGKLDLTGAPLGSWNVMVTNPDGGSSTIPGGFTVAEVAVPNLWVSINGPGRTRPGRVWSGYLAYGNTGNVDARGVEIQLSGIPNFNRVTLRTTDPPAVMSEEIGDDQKVRFYAKKVAPGTTQYVPLRIVFAEEGKYELTARMLEGVFDPDAVLPIDPNIEALMEIQEATDPSGSSPGSLRGVIHVTGTSGITFDFEVVETPGHRDPEVGGTEPFPGQKRYTLRTTYEHEGTIYLVEGIMEGSENAFDRLSRAGTYSAFSSFTSRTAARRTRGTGIRLLQALPPNPIPVQSAHGHQEQEISRANLVDCLFDKGVIDGEQAAELNRINDDSSNWNLLGGFSSAVAGVGGLVGLVAMGGKGTADSDFETQLKIYLRGAGYDIPPEIGSNEKAMQIAKAICHAGDIKFAGFASKSVLVTNSNDPNEKAGPEGSGTARYIEGDEPLPYVVKFENLDTATAPAQEVRITDQLDADLDLSTVSLGAVSFGDTFVAPPPGLQDWTTDVDLRPEQDLIVRIEAKLTGDVLTWVFRSLDPDTLEPIDDAGAGFLPPNDNSPEGEGAVMFSAAPKVGLSSGKQIENTASIIFDANAPIVTNTWLNTIDNDAPTSQVDFVRPGCNLEVAWSGTDITSGVRNYDVFVSDNGGPFELWQLETTAGSAFYQGVSGHTYGFYSVARDGAGHVEPVPAVADTTARAGCSSGTGSSPSPTPSGSPTASPTTPPPPACPSPLQDLCGSDGPDVISVGPEDDVNGDGKVLVALFGGNDTGCVDLLGTETTSIEVRGGPGDDTLIADGSGPCAATSRLVGKAIERLGMVIGLAVPNRNLRMVGGKGNDRLIGNGAPNELSGRAGNDVAFGRAGNDLLKGGSGRDRLHGGVGNDDIDGGLNADHCRGGTGTDRLAGCE